MAAHAPIALITASNARQRAQRWTALVSKYATVPALAAFVFVSAALLYALTLYPRVGGRFQYGDAAKWQYIGHILGIPHPPGSPLYVLVTHVWGALPLPGSLALRIELLSLGAGATAALLVFLSAIRLRCSRVSALIAAATFIGSASVWTFATEAEVYMPLGLVAAFALHRTLIAVETKRVSDRALVYAALALGVSVHYAIITMAPAVLVLLIDRETLRTFSLKDALALVLAATLGIAPFAWMFARAPHAPYSELANHDFQSFVRFLLVQQYAGDLRAGDSHELLFDRSGAALSALCAQIGVVALIAAPLGWRRMLSTQRRAALALASAALLPLVLIAVHRNGDERGETVPAMVALAVLVGSAFDGGTLVRVAGFGAALLVAQMNGVALADAAATDPMRRDTDEIHDYPWDIDCVLEGAERNAVIVAPHADYGARQYALYYRFADRRVAAKNLSFAWLENPHEQWSWAAPKLDLPANDPRPVYTFRHDHEKQLVGRGYHSEKLTYADLNFSGACQSEHPATVLYRLHR